jgi:hypothetical protein
LPERFGLKEFTGEITSKRPSHISNWNIWAFRRASPKVTKSQEVMTLLVNPAVYPHQVILFPLIMVWGNAAGL